MRILTLSFNISLHPGEISAFRSCIVKLVGCEHEIFHNHDNSAEGATHYNWGYPLVQYTVRRGCATVIGIGEGAHAIQTQLLPNLKAQLEWNGSNHKLNGYQIKERIHNWQHSETPQQYGLFGWLALNQANYEDWKVNTAMEARRVVLERALTGHLRVVAKAAGIQELNQVVGGVVQVDNQKRAAFHGTQLVRFHALITSTLVLPFGLGIGRASAFGFGEIMPVRVYQEIIRRQSKSATVEL